MDLKEIRKAIDATDYEIVKLLNRRMEYALRLKRLKSGVVEPDREREVFEHVRSYSHSVTEPGFTERLYATIIEESRRIQEKELRLAGFQGEHGAYSEVAAHAWASTLVSIPCLTFHDVFREVETGQLDFGIVPVENSLEGAITEVNDLLIETKLRIVGEATIPVHHALLALPEQDYREIRAVYSHPQALGQCREFISRHKFEARPFYDTAGAAAMLREQKPAATGVIASRLCADLYHLEILKENVEDHPSNTTRFVVLSREASPEYGNKCSCIFSVSHRPGGLFSVLEILSDRGINMTRIDSHRYLRGNLSSEHGEREGEAQTASLAEGATQAPGIDSHRYLRGNLLATESSTVREDPGSYAFFLDFEGSDRDSSVTEALDLIRSRSRTFKFLGCYRASGEQ